MVDAGEHPELYDALLNGSLNQVTCPHCGHVSQGSGPFLLHDPMLKRVYFAVPGDADEHVWREHAQTLLYALVSALPEEERLPYLSDVHISQELDGLRQTLTRRGRRGRPDTAGRARTAAGSSAIPQPVASSPLLDWIQTLLAADTPAEFQEVVRSHPELLSDAATTVLESLAAEASSAGQPDAVRAIQRVRATLHDMRTAGPDLMPPSAAQDALLPEDDTEALLEAAAEQLPPTAEPVSNAAYQEFLGAGSPEDLVDAARSHPILLEPEADAAIALRAEEALDTGNERLAALIDERRVALADLREQLTGEHTLLEALNALLAAESEDALARVLGEHPALLTAAAQQALMTLAAGARARNDEHLAVYAVECRAMLREVRRGLETI